MRNGRPLSSLFLFAMILALVSSGCLQRSGLLFNPGSGLETYTLTGSITLTNPVESDLLASIKNDIIQLTDFTKFTVSVGTTTAIVATEGSFTLVKVPFSSTMVMQAKAGKILLKRRVYPRDLRYTDLAKLTIDSDTTTRALIWEKAHQDGVELTEADIMAREYTSMLASISATIRLCMILPKASVPQTILDLDLVKNQVNQAVATIIPREKILTEAFSVLKNIFERHDTELLAYYLSPDFGNDWDSTSNYDDALSTFAGYIEHYDITNASYSIQQMEFLPDGYARVRVAAQIFYTDHFSSLKYETPLYTFDSLWRREGNFWKILRNIPYKKEHPTQLGADARYGEIIRAHVDLQTALFQEKIDVFETLISPTFTNAWDTHSTSTDLLLTLKKRFNTYDVKSAEYVILYIEFVGNNLARVHCSAQVKLINIVTGLDTDSGKINAVVEWQREKAGWRLFKNLPYKTFHPKNILNSILLAF